MRREDASDRLYTQLEYAVCKFQELSSFMSTGGHIDGQWELCRPADAHKMADRVGSTRVLGPFLTYFSLLKRTRPLK